MNLQALVDSLPGPVYDTMTLGQIIDALEKANADAECCFDFPSQYPKGIDSWRGVYAQLALEYGPERIKVSKVLEFCRDAVGATFTGYKGGEYEMDRDTPVHVANYGEAGSTRISHIDTRHATKPPSGEWAGYVVIHTRYDHAS